MHKNPEMWSGIDTQQPVPQSQGFCKANSHGSADGRNMKKYQTTKTEINCFPEL
jgi:hypothetical protein